MINGMGDLYIQVYPEFWWKNDYHPVEYKYKISCEYIWIIEANF